MGTGARLAEERDRWTAEWQAIDLDQEGEWLLDLMEHTEELQAAVPGVRVADSAGLAGRPEPVLIGVTDRRILVVGGWRGADTHRLTSIDEGSIDEGVQLDAASRARLRDLVDRAGDAWPAALSGGLNASGCATPQ